MSRFVSAVFLTSLFLGAGAGFALAQSTLQTMAWTPSPAKITQGTTVTDVILSVPAADCGTGAGQVNDAFLRNSTVPPAATAQPGLGVSAGTVRRTGICELTVALTPTASATVGPMRLTLTAANAATDGTAQAVGIATITIASSQSGPIPDGLSQQVDADYVVLPFQTASDNYGKRVAEQ